MVRAWRQEVYACLDNSDTQMCRLSGTLRRVLCKYNAFPAHPTPPKHTFGNILSKSPLSCQWASLCAVSTGISYSKKELTRSDPSTTAYVSTSGKSDRPRLWVRVCESLLFDKSILRRSWPKDFLAGHSLFARVLLRLIMGNEYQETRACDNAVPDRYTERKP